MKGLSIIVLLALVTYSLQAQPLAYTVSNAHSHNDYEQKVPFWLAYNEGFGSIEADIFLRQDSLVVAHSEKELSLQRTLEAYYLDPLKAGVRKNGGRPFLHSTAPLQVLIDIKTDSIHTLARLVEVLGKYPELTGNPAIKFVITGNRPAPSLWPGYPSWIWFDGVLSEQYDQAALDKVVMLSDDFKSYSQWNGKGIVPAKEWALLQAAVKKAHQLKKTVRFWDAPDFINAWYQFMHLQVDYINTDHIAALSEFLHQLPKTSYTGADAYQPYQPTYKTDGIDRPVKNVILLIGDGTGLAQLYTGYTANKAALNIFTMRSIGLSKTSSYDSYVTDSAPGSTAFSSGEKTNNRSVGVDHTGKALPLLPVILQQKKKIRTGLVTCGDIADATPADFYAHQAERSNAMAILRDLKNAPIDVLMGSGDESLNNVPILNEGDKAAVTGSMLQELQPEYTVVPAVDSIRAAAGKKWIVVEKRAGLSMLDGRGDWLQKAFNKTLSLLSPNKPGFFIMTEGAQVDYGGHANDLPYVAMEVMDFDRTVGEALRFADKDGETLVIVTADHETGGLTLLDGDYRKGYVGGQFATNDHTAIPVPVFAYGPRSGLFRGVYENTEVFRRILQAYGL
jgi:alkaline phosphatase